jgi:EpsI family protein
MLSSASPSRFWITSSLLAGTFVLLHTVSHGEAVVPHKPLRDLPYTIGAWTGTEQPLSEKVLQVVGVTDYTNRFYLSPQQGPTQLYVGYYASQRTGDTIHSPKNCLPGAGWDPVQSGYATISIPGRLPIVVNEYIIQQGLNKQLVFYWYQGRGRVIASEYSGKFWMVNDAILHHRTDGALVRLSTPMNDGEDAAYRRLEKFAQLVFPQLDSLIPN